MKCKKETKTISAKPKIYKVNKNKLTIFKSELSSKNSFEIILDGSFLNISNVYLSSSEINMFLDATFYNPFSGVQNLSAKNLMFYAKKIQNFSFTDNFLIFDIPQSINSSGFVDIIIENEAGYTKLTNDSILKTTCVQQFEYFNPTISGIYINLIFPFIILQNYEGYLLQENDDRIYI
jgi:hypothetical protein